MIDGQGQASNRERSERNFKKGGMNSLGLGRM